MEYDEKELKSEIDDIMTTVDNIMDRISTMYPETEDGSSENKE